MENVYNTTDPQKLLDLKRQEADALLDVLKTINHDELNIKQLCLIARNTLRAQLGVKKMVFFYEYEQLWKEGIQVGFPAFSRSEIEEMIDIKTITVISSEYHPALYNRGVEYVVPIKNRDEVSAFFAIADFADSEIEAQGDIIFIETLGNILSVAIRNKQLFKEKMEQEFLRKELEVASTIQDQLLISDFSRFREIDVFGMNVAHHGVGGDFYDVIKKGRGNTFVCIADVSGKGIGAALLMSNLQANLRALCAQSNDLEAIIKELNRILFNITTGEKFVTLFLARIDSRLRKITYINAGHNYPVFIQNGKVNRLDNGCILLGIMPELTIERSSVTYQPNDLLFMFTDGVVEQTNLEEEMFGSERIIEKLKESGHKDSENIVQDIRNTLTEFSQQVRATDDITMLSVKFCDNRNLFFFIKWLTSTPHYHPKYLNIHDIIQ